MTSKHQLFTQIARDHLFIQTLEQRNHDSLDFHDVGVGSVQDALDAAYRAGLAELLTAAQALISAQDKQLDTDQAWRRLRQAIRKANKENALPKP